MGRTLIRNPKIFLFDEPLSNLDAKLRTEIKKLHQRLGATIVYVTHDQIEAMTMAMRIAIMWQGCVIELTEPTGPDTLAVALVGAVEATARLRADTTIQPGHRVTLAVDMRKASLFDPETEQRILAR